MKKLMLGFVLIAVQGVFGLQAPYLYTADSVADSLVRLTWRNNSAGYFNVIVLRKSTVAGQYSVVGSTAGTATSFTDTVRQPAQGIFYYALTADSQNVHADTSNVDSVRITPPQPPPPVGTFVAPPDFFISWDTSAHAVPYQYSDSSTTESGYKLYRSTNFGPFQMIKDRPSLIPAQEGFVRDTDHTVSPNTWYMYYVAAYEGQQTLSTQVDTVFTFDINALKRDAREHVLSLTRSEAYPSSTGPGV